MLMIHIFLIFIYVILLLLSITVKIPGELKGDEAYYRAFYRSAALICRLRSKRSASAGRKTAKRLLMLSPGGNGDMLYSVFEIRRVGKALTLLFVGNLIALLMCIMSMANNPLYGENTVERNGYGKGEKSVTLDVYADGERVMDALTIDVEEKQYSEEEAAALFEEMKLKIDEIVMGENESLDYVCHDLVLPAALEGYPVGIEWQLKDYRAMDSEGHLKSEGIDEQGTLQELTALLTYRGFQAEYRFSAMLFPPPVDESFNSSFDRALKESDRLSSTGDLCSLPTVVDGREITYTPHESSDSLLILALIAICCVVVIRGADRELTNEIKKRDTQMMIDYPQIVSKLNLLLGAGMTIQGAFTKIAEDYEKARGEGEMRFAYEEMLLTVREVGLGLSEQDAYVKFGNRCNLQKYVKLGATLSQNLKRGGARLLEILEGEEKDAFEERKALARRLGEEAGTKLLAPMGIMLIIVMVIVVVPAFLSFNM